MPDLCIYLIVFERTKRSSISLWSCRFQTAQATPAVASINVAGFFPCVHCHYSLCRSCLFIFLLIPHDIACLFSFYFHFSFHQLMHMCAHPPLPVLTRLFALARALLHERAVYRHPCGWTGTSISFQAI